jgi:hypothetical protein
MDENKNDMKNTMDENKEEMKRNMEKWNTILWMP